MRWLTILSTASILIAASTLPAQAADLGTDKAGINKTSSTGGRLLLPFYQVEVGNPSGTTTLYALRNEAAQTVQVTANYFRTNSPQAPVRTVAFSLGRNQIRTINIRDVANLPTDPDGFTRGFLVFDVAGSGGDLHGDFFQVTPGEAFATGSRLVNLDAARADDRCSTQSIRYLRGGVFNGGTEYTIWLDIDDIPANLSISYSVYDEAGGDEIFTSSFIVDEAAFTLSADFLLNSPPGTNASSGAIEFQFPGVTGHVSGVMNALGLYSVGFEATCLE